MFRRTTARLPADPSYPANLTALGYRLNDQGQFVNMDDPSSFFQFFHTDNDRANETHKEAMHECARLEVLQQLATLGVKPVYLSTQGRRVKIEEEKPQGPHVAILTTDLKVLSDKNDVVIVVNEHVQDLGIWAYRTLMREGGVEQGFAVGLARKLRGWNEDSTALMKTTDPRMADGSNEAYLAQLRARTEQRNKDQTQGCDATDHEHIATTEQKLDRLSLTGTEHEVSGTVEPIEKGVSETADTPGLVILNPGQLIYSPSLNCTMSQATWLARPKANALEDHIPIDPVHNRVLGHSNAEEHIATVFETIIPKIVSESARLYVVGLSEGGEAFLKWLDEKMKSKPAEDIPDPSLAKRLGAIALVQPTHDPTQLQSARVKSLLRKRGKSYVLSDLPKGKLLYVPEAKRPVIEYSDDLNLAQRRLTEGDLAGEGSAQTLEETKGSAAYIAKYGLDRVTDARKHLPELGSENENRSTAPEQESEAEPDHYAHEEISSPTFSSGESSISELIWPKVMDDVLAWFKQVSLQPELVDEAEVEGEDDVQSGSSGEGTFQLVDEQGRRRSILN